MLRRRKTPPQEHADRPAAELHRAPIITQHVIIREAARSDAEELERTMEAAHFGPGERTTDGARRFGDGMAEVPMWSATRAVCELGSANIVGGVVITEVPHPTADVRRIGWWLQPGAEHYGTELVAATDERLRAMGATEVVMHLRSDDADGIGVAEQTGFRRCDPVRHTTVTGDVVDFWEFRRP